MTIGIGALCNGGTAVVVASDRMITGRYPPIEFEHNVSKVEELGPSCVAVTAGDALAHIELFRKVKQVLYQLQAPPISDIVENVKQAFQTERRRRAQDVVLGPRGITMVQFYQEYIRFWPTEVALGVDRDITRNDYGLEIIVAGVDFGGAHLYGVDDPGILNCYDSLGFHAIGSGMSHALVSLIASRAIPTTPLRDVVYDVYAAKRAAETAPGVGEATDLIVIRVGPKEGPKIERLSIADMTVLKQAYENQMQPKTESLNEALQALEITMEVEADEMGGA